MSKVATKKQDDHCVAPNLREDHDKGLELLKYLIIGVVFGIVFVKAEIISWFRIQEMFRLQSFHMYGVIGSAVVTGMISVQLIKRLNIKTIHGESIVIPDDVPTERALETSLFFGDEFEKGTTLITLTPG